MKTITLIAAAMALAACAGGSGGGGPLAPSPPALPEPPPPPPQLALVTDCADPDVFPDGDAWSGAATAVIDGDSFCMGDIEVRLRRYSAPEWDAPGGSEARDALRAVLSAAPELACEGFARSYDRVLAECRMADGQLVEFALRKALAPRSGGGQ